VAVPGNYSDREATLSERDPYVVGGSIPSLLLRHCPFIACDVLAQCPTGD
jgi:hypothetical protein